MEKVMNKNRIWFKIVATIIVCLFTVNTLAEAAPGRIVPASNNTLQPQLKSKPMVDVAETVYKVQVRNEFHHIIEMVLKGYPFLNINGALDTAAGTGVGRVLDVRPDFLETDDGVVLNIGFLKGAEGAPEFHIFFDKRCKSIMDLVENEDLIRYVDAPTSTKVEKSKTQKRFFTNISKLRKNFKEVEQPAPLWYVKELLDEEMDTYFERKSPSAKKENLMAFHKEMVLIVDGIISDITKDGVTPESAMSIIGGTLAKYNVKSDDILRWVFLRLLRGEEWDLLSRFIEWYHSSLPVEQFCLTKKYMLYLETLLGEDSEKRHMLFKRQMEVLDVPTEQFGHRPFLDILRLKKHFNYQAITESKVKTYLFTKMSRYDFEGEWVSLKDFDEDGMVRAAVSYLLNMIGHENRSERREVLMENIYAREFDRSLYFRKEHIEHYPDDSGFDVHADRDNPYREMAAFIIGRQIGVNTAKTAITEQGETFSALSITTDEEDLYQQDAKSAESAALVFNVLIRRWDDSRDMIQRSPVGKSFVSFDHDVAFNPEYLDIDKYISTLKELGEGKDQHWSVEDFDIEVIRETIEKVRDMDVDEVMGLIEKKVSSDTIKTNMGEEEINFFPYVKRYLMLTMDSIEEDTREAFKAMTGSALKIPGNSAQSLLANSFYAPAWKVFTFPSTLFHEISHYVWAWIDWKRGVTKYEPVWSERDIFDGEIVNVYGKAKMFGGIVGNIIGLIVSPLAFLGFANMLERIGLFDLGFPAACILMAYPFTLNLISIFAEIIGYFYDMGDLVEGRETSYETEERDKQGFLEEDEEFDEEDDPVSMEDLQDLASDNFSWDNVGESEPMTFEVNPGINRQQHLEELKEDVAALDIRRIGGKYTVVINREFSEPTILPQVLKIYRSILQDVIEGNDSLGNFLVNNSAAFLGYDAMSDFQRVFIHNKYEPRDRRDPREFIEQYTNTIYQIRRRNINRLPEDVLRKLLMYRKFKLDYLRRTDLASKQVLLADEAKNIREVVVVTDEMRRNSRDLNWTDPDVMLVDNLGFKLPTWRRKARPGEKIIFAKWRGRIFMFYISRSHTSMGTEVHLWRNCDFVDITRGWFAKSHPENLDDLPGKLKILLDEAIYSGSMNFEKVRGRDFDRVMGSGYPEKGINKGVNFALLGDEPYERFMPQDEESDTADTYGSETTETAITDFDTLEALPGEEDETETLDSGIEEGAQAQAGTSERAEPGDDYELDDWDLEDYEIEKDTYKIGMDERGLNLRYLGKTEHMPYDFFEWCRELKAFEVMIMMTQKGIKAEMLDSQGRIMYSIPLSLERPFDDFLDATKRLVYEQPFYGGPFKGIVNNVINDKIMEFKIESDGRSIVKFSTVERFTFGAEIEFGTGVDQWQYWDIEKGVVSAKTTDHIYHVGSGSIESRITEEEAARIAKNNDTSEIYPDDYVGRFKTASGMTQIVPPYSEDKEAVVGIISKMKDGIYDAEAVVQGDDRARKELAGILEEIDLEFFPKTNPEFWDETSRKLRELWKYQSLKDGEVSIAVRNKRIVGFVEFSFAAPKSGSRVYINPAGVTRFAVLPEERTGETLHRLVDDAISKILETKWETGVHVLDFNVSNVEINFLKDKYCPARTEDKNTGLSWHLERFYEKGLSGRGACTLSIRRYDTEEGVWKQSPEVKIGEIISKMKDGIYNAEAVVQGDGLRREVLAVMTARFYLMIFHPTQVDNIRRLQESSDDLYASLVNNEIRYAIRNGNIVGFHQFALSAAGHTAVLKRVGVAQNMQSRGIGTSLLDAGISDLLKMDPALSVLEFNAVSGTKEYYNRYLTLRTETKATELGLGWWLEMEDSREVDDGETHFTVKVHKRGDKKQKRLIEKQIELTRRIGEQILAGRNGIKSYLLKNKGVPIDITVDLSLLSREDLAKNMETWAYLVLMVRELENVNFVFEHPLEGEENLSKELANDLKNAPSVSETIMKLETEIKDRAKGLGLGVNVEDIMKSRINAGRREGAVEVPITSEARLKGLSPELLKDNQYPVAMKGLTCSGGGIALRNFDAALTVGLTTAALVIAERKGELDEVLANGRLLKKLKELYDGLPIGYKIPLDKATLTEHMLNPNPATRINLAVTLALPPIARDAVNMLERLHENIQHVLMSA